MVFAIIFFPSSVPICFTASTPSGFETTNTFPDDALTMSMNFPAIEGCSRHSQLRFDTRSVPADRTEVRCRPWEVQGKGVQSW